jgi:hypothetical protein
MLPAVQPATAVRCPLSRSTDSEVGQSMDLPHRPMGCLWQRSPSMRQTHQSRCAILTQDDAMHKRHRTTSTTVGSMLERWKVKSMLRLVPLEIIFKYDQLMSLTSTPQYLQSHRWDLETYLAANVEPGIDQAATAVFEELSAHFMYAKHG